MVEANGTHGATALIIRSRTPSTIAGGRFVGSVALVVDETERAGEHGSELRVLAAQDRHEGQRGSGRALERPLAVVEGAVDELGRAAVEDELAGGEGAALEPPAADHDPLALEPPGDDRPPSARTVP